MIIGACGFGATGSSVLTDLLREYDEIQIYDKFEFWLAYRVDGLEDLEYHLMKQYAKGASGDYAIKRFLDMTKCYKTPWIHKPCSGKTFERLSKEFVASINQINYPGVETADICTGKTLRDIFAFAFKKVFIPKIVEKITHKPSYLWPCRMLNYSIEPENFYEEAKKYMMSIIREMGADMSKPVCLDQPFEGNAPENSMKFFEDPYAVVIDRDPRDLFLAGKYTKDPNFKFSPKEDVEEFIIYYRNMRRKISKSNDRVLRMRFEDLIYNYDESITKLEEFLHLGTHVRPKEMFNPSRSINNTQLVRLHPEDIDNIKRIEEELAEFLYPFESYQNVKFNGKPFDGAARKTFEQ